jgi:hypothetical protein
MNTGQTILVLAALLLLSGVILGVNRLLISKTSTMLESEADLTALSVGQSMLDEIMSQAYDKVVANGTKVFNDSSQFTATSSLGPDVGESITLPDTAAASGQYKSVTAYNDVDDYTGYTRLVNTTMGTFAVTDTVFYVSESNPNLKQTPQSFYKKIVVTVRHPNMVPSDNSYNKFSGPYFMQLTDVSVYRRYF